jgi:hypothetical protein
LLKEWRRSKGGEVRRLTSPDAKKHVRFQEHKKEVRRFEDKSGENWKILLRLRLCWTLVPTVQ